MLELFCTARRIGDYESRTEEYELAFAVEDAPPKGLRIKYQAARAYEINAALDQCVEAARAAWYFTRTVLSGASPAAKETSYSSVRLS